MKRRMWLEKNGPKAKEDDARLTEMEIMEYEDFVKLHGHEKKEMEPCGLERIGTDLHDAFECPFICQQSLKSIKFQ